MTHFVYVVECSDGTYYTGYTTNLARRIDEHNRAKSGARYTRARRPVVLRYVENCSSRSIALKREAEIKSLTRSAKESLWKEPGPTGSDGGGIVVS